MWMFAHGMYSEGQALLLLESKIKIVCKESPFLWVTKRESGSPEGDTGMSAGPVALQPQLRKLPSHTAVTEASVPLWALPAQGYTPTVVNLWLRGKSLNVSTQEKNRLHLLQGGT